MNKKISNFKLSSIQISPIKLAIYEISTAPMLRYIFFEIG